MSIKIPKTIPSSKLKNSRQLIKWINKLVGVNYYKLEDCKNGVAYCRVMNKLFPSVLSLSKINQMPTQDFEINRNYKVLQTAFQKIGVRKPIEISQLVKGVHKSHLSFLQWFLVFYDLNISENISFKKETTSSNKTKKPIRKKKLKKMKSTNTKTKTTKNTNTSTNTKTNKKKKLRSKSRFGTIKKPISSSRVRKLNTQNSLPSLSSRNKTKKKINININPKTKLLNPNPQKKKKAILKSSTNKKSALLKKRAKNLKPLNKKTKARPTRKDQQKSTSRLRPRSDSLADPRRNKRTRLNSKANSVELNKLKSQIEKLKKEIDDKKEQIEYKGKKIKNCQDAVVSLHKDVKYYYGKLLKIEKLCTSLKNQYPILDQVLDEIYSSDEENDNDEEIVENESNSDYDDEEEDSDDSVSDDSEVEYEK
ncbi:microtubule-associated protein rp/eb family member [Anaeramoeba flamelloides]|uniref:Microtubule-associated protein rp/eb family member n=1 Tax=Anaeramoeba flamelloides TaxID=1746091 RepID=A0AAV7ZU74_9EUKA|nr:microtubule-associated protein rp/eb family member [Anaeramoeba flamelloides]